MDGMQHENTGQANAPDFIKLYIENNLAKLTRDSYESDAPDIKLLVWACDGPPGPFLTV